MKAPSRQSLHSNLAEINITPLVDVMLVLLIIFMVTAPMMQSGITVKLPSAETRSNPSAGGLVLTLTKDRYVYMNDRIVNLYFVVFLIFIIMILRAAITDFVAHRVDHDKRIGADDAAQARFIPRQLLTLSSRQLQGVAPDLHRPTPCTRPRPVRARRGQSILVGRRPSPVPRPSTGAPSGPFKALASSGSPSGSSGRLFRFAVNSANQTPPRPMAAAASIQWKLNPAG